MTCQASSTITVQLEKLPDNVWHLVHIYLCDFNSWCMFNTAIIMYNVIMWMSIIYIVEVLHAAGATLERPLLKVRVVA